MLGNPVTMQEIAALAVADIDLEALARAEIPRVERLLRRILGPRDDMEDLVQSVFVEVFRALPGFRGEASVSTFIGAITIRVARRAMRKRSWLARWLPLRDELPTQSPSPERGAAERRALRRVRRALEGLRPPKRIAFALWALEGLSVEAIAAMMEASPAATKSRIYAAQRELAAKALRDPVLREILGETP